MRKNKKGFTLIEIIAVLVIVAILALLIVPAVTKYMRKGRDEYNKQLEQQLEVVGKDYYSANPKELPIENGSRAKPVWLATLKSNNYTSEEFFDADGGQCIKSYVQVKKTNGGHQYTPCLVCDNYESENAECTIDVNKFDVTNDGVVNEPESEAPKCSIELSNKSGNWTNSNVVATINYEVDGENGRTIAGLSIDGVAITEGINAGGTSHSYPYTISQSGYNKRVKATVMDDLGYSIGECESAQVVKIDKTGPVCIFSDPYKGSATWSNSSYPGRGETVYYDLTCSDSESKSVTTLLSTIVPKISVNNLEAGKTSLKSVTGVSRSVGTNGTVYKIKATGNDTGPARLNLASGAAVDAAGNSSSGAESPAVYVWNPTTGGGGGELPTIDTSVPSCNITMTKADGTIYNEGEWSDQDVTVTATCSPTANITYTPTRTVTSEGETVVNIKASNIYNTSNSSEYTARIKIDKTDPTCKVTMRKYEGTLDASPTYIATYQNTYWTQYKVRIDIDCEDTGGSGLDTNSTYMNRTGGTGNYKKYMAITTEGVNTVRIYARDNAGNQMSTITKTIKRDTTDPKLVFQRSGNSVRAVCRDGDGNSNLSDITIHRFKEKQYTGPIDDLTEYEGNKGSSINSVYVNLYEPGVATQTYIAAGCIDAALNGTWIQYEYTMDLYTKTITRRDYFWSSKDDGSGSCNAGVNCCSTSSGRECNSENHGKKRYFSCSEKKTTTKTYEYTGSYKCLKKNGKAEYFFSSKNSGGGTCSPSSSSCCGSFTCNASNHGSYKYTGCSSTSTSVGTGNYSYGSSNVCLLKSVSGGDATDYDNVTECEEKDVNHGTYINTVTCKKTQNGSEVDMGIRKGELNPK